MKNNRFIMHTLTFVSGVIIGGAIFGILWFANGCSGSVSAASPSPISLKDARDMYHNYLNKDKTPMMVGRDTIKAVTIDRNQLAAIEDLLNNQNLAACRVYIGLDANSQRVGIVLGVYSDGRDATTLNIYSTGVGKAGPCPPICDRGSQMN
jgi:hypothetical protein